MLGKILIGLGLLSGLATIVICLVGTVTGKDYFKQAVIFFLITALAFTLGTVCSAKIF
jgi:hypothetical protein